MFINRSYAYPLPLINVPHLYKLGLHAFDNLRLYLSNDVFVFGNLALCNVYGICLLAEDKQRATALPELLLRGCNFHNLGRPQFPLVPGSRRG
jgi:hypothetical protein